MRKLAFVSFVALAMMTGGASAAPGPVLGTNGQALRGTYVCKGQGHGQNGAPSGLYIVLNLDDSSNVTGGELGQHMNSAFCTYSILPSSLIAIDASQVGHATLNLKPMAQPPNPMPPGAPLLLLLPACRPVTETFEFAGLNHGALQIEFTETDSGVEAGGRCEQVASPVKL